MNGKIVKAAVPYSVAVVVVGELCATTDDDDDDSGGGGDDRRASVVFLSTEIRSWIARRPDRYVKKNTIRLSVVNPSVNPSVLQPLEKGGLTGAGMKMTRVVFIQTSPCFFACNS
jgi:hypothetical protein